MNKWKHVLHLRDCPEGDEGEAPPAADDGEAPAEDDVGCGEDAALLTLPLCVGTLDALLLAPDEEC